MAKGKRQKPGKFPVSNRAVLIDPDRGRVLDPTRIISLMPIKPEHVVMDVGCGNGFFTFPLAKHLGKGRVYAVDMQAEMLQDIRHRVDVGGIRNVEAVLSEELDIPLSAQSVDGAFSAFMFHETYNPPAFLQMVRSILKPNGWLTLLEWYKKEMENGPPVAERIDEQECMRLLKEAGFKLSSQPYLSDEHYMYVVINQPD